MFYGSLGVTTKAKTFSRFTHTKNGIIVYHLGKSSVHKGRQRGKREWWSYKKIAR